MSSVTNIQGTAQEELSSKEKWENFVYGKLVNFAELSGLEKITVDNGLGGKAKLKRDKNGNWIGSVTWEGPIE